MDIHEEETKKLLEQKADVLKSIAHPVRLCILTKLYKTGTCNVTDLQHCLNVPQSTISQHLAKLRGAGIVTAKRKGVEVKYSLNSIEIKNILNVLLEQDRGEKNE